MYWNWREVCSNRLQTREAPTDCSRQKWSGVNAVVLKSLSHYQHLCVFLFFLCECLTKSGESSWQVRGMTAGRDAARVDITPSNKTAQHWQRWWNIYPCFHFTCSNCPVSVWRDRGGDTNRGRERKRRGEKEGGHKYCTHCQTWTQVVVHAGYIFTRYNSPCLFSHISL